MGLTGSVSHILRRDENSGTTDTIKDRIIVVANSGALATRYPYTGGRFCNGAALGNINGATPLYGKCSTTGNACLNDKGCGASETCWFNLNNPDYDPMRRTCMSGDSTISPTSCTDQTSGIPCAAGDGNNNCTQGLVVALTDPDRNASDITTSIGHRVGAGQNLLLGYAGRESADLTFPTKALTINTVSAYNDENIIASIYLLARRLFIQNSERNSGTSGTSNYDYPTDDATSQSIAGGGGAQLADEKALWSGFLSDRSKMDPIVRQYKFIRCSRSADGGDPAGESNNLCAKPASPTPSPLGNYAPLGTRLATAAGAWSIDSTGQCFNGTTLVRCAASSGSQCVGGVADAGGCPVYNNRLNYAPCTVATDCASGKCTGYFGGNTPGELHDLYCTP
jgi:hypothetical protein